MAWICFLELGVDSTASPDESMESATGNESQIALGVAEEIYSTAGGVRVISIGIESVSDSGTKLEVTVLENTACVAKVEVGMKDAWYAARAVSYCWGRLSPNVVAQHLYYSPNHHSIVMVMD